MPQPHRILSVEASHSRTELLRLLVDSAIDFAIVSLDTEGRYSTWNSGAERILGYSEAEAIRQHSSLIFAPEDRERGEPEKEMRTALSQGRAEDERWHVKKDGSRFWASGVMTPLLGEGGTHIGYAKVLRDVTQQKRADEARTFLASIIESSQDSVVTVDFDGIITSWNRAAEDLYSYPAGEAVGKPLAMLVLPDDLNSIASKIDDVKQSREVTVFDTVRIRKGEDRIHLEIVMSPVKNKNEQVIGVSTVARDVTERRQAAQELERRVAERTAEVNAALAERKSLMARVVRAQEEERRRVSRDLHDSTGQYMVALTLELDQMESDAVEIRRVANAAAKHAMTSARLAVESAQEAEDATVKAAASSASQDESRLSVVAAEASRKAAIAGTDAAAAAAAANTAVSTVNEAAPRVARLKSVAAALSHDIHKLAIGLRPTSLDDLGLVPALTALCEEWSDRAGVVAEFVTTGMGTKRVSPDVETTVYRVVQEALTNAAKHAVTAGFTNINVTLQRFSGTAAAQQSRNDVSGIDNYISATVEDDGPGFDLKEAMRKGRLGLAGMRERAELAGGTLEIESTPGTGTTVFLRVPISTG